MSMYKGKDPIEDKIYLVESSHKKISFHNLGIFTFGILWVIIWPIGLTYLAIDSTCRGKVPFEDLGFKSKITAWVFGFPIGLPCLAIHYIAKTDLAKFLGNKALDLATKIGDSVTDFAYSVEDFIMRKLKKTNRMFNSQMDNVNYRPKSFNPLPHNNLYPAPDTSTSTIPSSKDLHREKSFIPKVEAISRRMSI